MGVKLKVLRLLVYKTKTTTPYEKSIQQDLLLLLVKLEVLRLLVYKTKTTTPYEKSIQQDLLLLLLLFFQKEKFHESRTLLSQKEKFH